MEKWMRSITFRLEFERKLNSSYIYIVLRFNADEWVGAQCKHVDKYRLCRRCAM